MRTQQSIGTAIRQEIDQELFWVMADTHEVIGEKERFILDRMGKAAANAVHKVLREYGVVND